MIEMLKRLFAPKNFTIILAFLISLGFALLRVFQVGPGNVDAIILFVLSALISWLILEKIGYFDKLEKDINEVRQDVSLITSQLDNMETTLSQPSGIHAVYTSRDKLPPYEEFVEAAQEKVFVISIDLEDTSSRYIRHYSK